MRRFKVMCVAASAVFSAATAQAGVIVDRSPDVIGQPFIAGFVNETTGQNFLMQFTLASATTLTGFDIYDYFLASGGVGSSATLKIRTDVAGEPDSVNLFSLATQISIVDTDGAAIDPISRRLHADFSAVLDAGVYWIGLSGDSFGWAAYGGFDTFPDQRQLSGNTVQFAPGVGRFAYRVTDDVLGVPEPATWGMLLGGFAITGIALRRRRVARAA